MNSDKACGLLAEMVAIHSPSGGEAELATRLTERMSDAGMCSWIDEAGNAVGEMGAADAPLILLIGHLDTAGDPLPTAISGDLLRGRGSVDAKGALAAMVAAAARSGDRQCRIRVVGAVEEEWPSSRGAVHVGNGERPALVIVGEPSGWNGVVLGYKGKLDLALRVRRPPTHSSNPARKATEVVVALWQRVLAEIGPTGVAFDHAGAALCALDGDMSEATAEISCRLPPGFDAIGFVDRIRAAALPDEVIVRNVVPATRSGRRDPVVQQLTASIRQHGVRPIHQLRAGTSDMNTLRAVWDIPMATYGPGNHRLDHSDHEFVRLSEFVRSISVLTSTLRGLQDRLASTSLAPAVS